MADLINSFNQINLSGTTLTANNGLLFVNNNPVSGVAAGVSSITATGSINSGTLTGAIKMSGAGDITVSTGTSGNIIISGNTGAYSNFITPSQTGNFVTTGSTGVYTGVFYPRFDNPSGYINNLNNYLDFNNNITNPSYVEGRLFYDTGEKALSYYSYLSGVNQNLGQENWIKVINPNATGISNGKVVYITGAVSGIPAIALAQANSESGSYAIGVTTINVTGSGGQGFVTAFGIVHSINVSGFIPGTKLYLSETTPGAFTATRPTGNNYVSSIGYVLNTGISGITGNILVTNLENNRSDDYYASSGSLNATGSLLQNQIIQMSGQAVVFDSGIQSGVVRQSFQFPITFNRIPFVFTQLKYLSNTGIGYPVVGISGVTTSGFSGVYSLPFSGTGYVLSIWATSGATAGGGGGSTPTGDLTGVFYPLTSNPAGYLTSSSAGVTSITATGSSINSGLVTGLVKMSGAGNIVVTTGIDISNTIVISGNTGAYSNFLTSSTVGGVRTITPTGTVRSGTISGNIIITGAGNVSIETGISGLLIISGDTGTYANFITPSQTGGFLTSNSLNPYMLITGTRDDIFAPLNIPFIVIKTGMNFTQTGYYRVYTVPTNLFLAPDSFEFITKSGTGITTGAGFGIGSGGAGFSEFISGYRINNYNTWGRGNYDLYTDILTGGQNINLNIYSGTTGAASTTHTGYFLLRGILYSGI